MTSTVSVMCEVADERARQDALWGVQDHPDGTGVDFGFYQIDARLARRRCQFEHSHKRGTFEEILTEEYHEALCEDDPESLRRELIQLAAVAVAWVEAIDRRVGN